ncbi:MAG TPA: Uma2 family endonuclease, partial [Chloroflexota bacterium]|nr:Uma2 family endonuclease [Chloroflexota bacterium]
VRLFGQWNREHRAGSVGVEVGFTLQRGPDTVRVPDVYFMAKGRLSHEASRRGYPDATPDLIVEIRSPNDTWQSLVDRANALLAAGARMALLVEPDQFIEVRRPGQEPRRLGLDDLFDGEDVLPGFACLVREFFPEEY